MNINEKTYEQFKEICQASPNDDADRLLANNFMEFVELLDPYATEEVSLNELTKYMFEQDPDVYQLFMSCILNLGIRANA